MQANVLSMPGWLDSPSTLQASVERLKSVKALGMDAAVDFHGRLHKPMAKQLAKALEPHASRPAVFSIPILLTSPTGSALHRRASPKRAPGRHQRALRPDHLPHSPRRAPLQPLGLQTLLRRPQRRHHPAGHLALRRHLRNATDSRHGRGVRCRARAALSAGSHRAGGVLADWDMYA